MKKYHKKNKQLVIRRSLLLTSIIVALFITYNLAPRPVQAVYRTATQKAEDCKSDSDIATIIGTDNFDNVCDYFVGGANGTAINFSSADIIKSSDTANDGSIDANLSSYTFNSATNIYAGQEMTTKVTSAECEIVDTNTGNVVGPCAVYGAVDTVTGSFTGSTSGWESSGKGKSVSVNYDTRLLTEGGNYQAVIKTSGVVMVGGKVVGFSTDQESRLEIDSSGPTKVDQYLEEDLNGLNLPENPPDPYQWKPADTSKIKYDITVESPYYAIVSCNPYVTPTHSYALDGDDSDTNLYTFPKDKHTGKIYAKIEMEVSYGSQPDIIYNGGGILTDSRMIQSGDADWKSACKDIPKNPNERVIDQEVTLENGQTIMYKIDGEKTVKAQRRRKIYRRISSVTCNEKGECSTPVVGPLEEYTLGTAGKDAIKVTISVTKKVLRFIANVFTHGVSCISKVEEGHELESWFNCVINTTIEDEESVDELAGMFGDVVGATVNVAKTMPMLAAALIPDFEDITIDIPPLVVVVYRNAESNLNLDSEMKVSVADGESYKIEVLGSSNKRDKTIEDKIYWSEEHKITVDSKATLTRTSYLEDGTQTDCNPTFSIAKKDQTGCDQPSNSVDLAKIYPSLTTKNVKIVGVDDEEKGILELDATGTTEDPAKIDNFEIGPEATSDYREESNQNIEEPSLGTNGMEISKTYKAYKKIDIELSKKTESGNQENKMSAKIYRPWNYRIYFSGEKNGFENGVAFISETGMTFGVTVNNKTNTLCSNRTINGIMADCSDDGGVKEQEGFPTKSPDLSVKLYLKIIKNHNIKTIEQLQDAINNPKIGTQGTYYYPNRFSLENDDDEKISIKIDKNDLNNVGVGDHVCYYFGVNHISSTADNSMYRQFPQEQWQFSQPICATVIALPTMQVEGGSIFSNGGKITTKTIQPSSEGNTFGSWVEYGIVSKGKVLGLASGKGLPNETHSYNTKNTTSDHPLTVTNKSSSGKSASGLEQQNDITGLGNITKVSLPISSEKIKSLKNKEVGCYTTITLDEKDTDATPCDKYDYKKQNTINDAIEMRSGTKIYYSEDNIEIKGNIILKETCWFLGLNCEKDVDMNNIPQVIIISGKDILIDENVTEINAWLIAGGTIDTCGSKTDDEKKNSDGRTHNSDICSRQLTINGPVYAKNIKLDRTFAENLGNSMAEKFDIGDLTYFWLYQQVSANESGYIETYSKSLAPRL